MPSAVWLLAAALAALAVMYSRRAVAAPAGTDGSAGGSAGSSGSAGGGGVSEYEPRPNDPLGIRNKNPMNLRDAGIAWRGRIGSNKGYVVFDSALNGIRAGMIDIHTGFTRDHEDTVRKIITEWAPRAENPTANYIDFVARRLRVAPDQRLDFRTHIIELARAIVAFEQGRDPYPLELYRAALAATGRA